METVTNRPRPRRSMKLEPAEKKAYIRKIASFPTKYDAALFFGFSLVTLDNISARGSGREKSILIIREKLKDVA